MFGAFHFKEYNVNFPQALLGHHISRDRKNKQVLNTHMHNNILLYKIFYQCH